MDLKSLDQYRLKIILLAFVGSGFVIGVTCLGEYWLGEKEDHKGLWELLVGGGREGD